MALTNANFPTRTNQINQGNTMKLFILLSLTLASLGVFSQTVMTNAEQVEKSEEIAKNIRRSYYITGHKNVSSSSTKLTQAKTTTILKDNELTESPLDADQVEEILKCSKSKKSCSVFLIEVGAEMYGGTGESFHWILLDITTGKYKEFFQVIYSE